MPINLFEYERLAEGTLSEMAMAYYAGGAHDEITLRRNREAFERLSLHYHVLAGVEARDLTTTILGHEISLPVLIAPTAFQRMAHAEGELATARAAGAAGTVMILSTLSNTDMEDVVAASSGPVWFQLYIYRDRGATQSLVERAEQAGCKAIVLTVDAPILGTRERDVRNRFRLPDGLTVRNLSGAGYDDLGRADGSALMHYVGSMFDAGLSWADFDWLRGITRLPIVVKGIVRPDDAARAVVHGAAAIVVSNHGGRQLDTAPATIDVLEPIADIVQDRAELLLDGGVRRGTDIVKALALGARAVLVGRPILWGLAVKGDEGVRAVLDLLRRELDEAMTLCGCRDFAAITRDLVR